MPLDYVSCFAMALRQIHGKVDIYQTNYIQHSANKRLPKVKGK